MCWTETGWSVPVNGQAIRSRWITREGDPEVSGRVPVFGFAWASADRASAGWATYKLKFGHHGGNHPCGTTRRQGEITAHNHNFAVDPDSINWARWS